MALDTLPALPPPRTTLDSGPASRGREGPGRPEPTDHRGGGGGGGGSGGWRTRIGTSLAQLCGLCTGHRAQRAEAPTPEAIEMGLREPIYAAVSTPSTTALTDARSTTAPVTVQPRAQGRAPAVADAHTQTRSAPELSPTAQHRLHDWRAKPLEHAPDGARFALTMSDGSVLRAYGCPGVNGRRLHLRAGAASGMPAVFNMVRSALADNRPGSLIGEQEVLHFLHAYPEMHTNVEREAAALRDLHRLHRQGQPELALARGLVPLEQPAGSWSSSDVQQIDQRLEAAPLVALVFDAWDGRQWQPRWKLLLRAPGSRFWEMLDPLSPDTNPTFQAPSVQSAIAMLVREHLACPDGDARRMLKPRPVQVLFPMEPLAATTAGDDPAPRGAAGTLRPGAAAAGRRAPAPDR